MTPPRLPLAAVLAPHRQNAVSPAMRTYTRPLPLPSGIAIGSAECRSPLSSFLAVDSWLHLLVRRLLTTVKGC